MQLKEYTLQTRSFEDKSTYSSIDSSELLAGVIKITVRDSKASNLLDLEVS